MDKELEEKIVDLLQNELSDGCSGIEDGNAIDLFGNKCRVYCGIEVIDEY